MWEKDNGPFENSSQKKAFENNFWKQFSLVFKNKILLKHSNMKKSFPIYSPLERQLSHLFTMREEMGLKRFEGIHGGSWISVTEKFPGNAYSQWLLKRRNWRGWWSSWRRLWSWRDPWVSFGSSGVNWGHICWIFVSIAEEDSSESWSSL